MVKDAVPLGECGRALVVKLRHHGDVLLAAPVLSVLKAHAPGLEVDALVYEDTAPMLSGHPALSALQLVGRRWKDEPGRLSREWRLLRALRARRYDLLVHLTEHPRGAWLARALGVRFSVAPAVPGRGKFWRKSFTHCFPVVGGGRRHQVELNLDALRRIGIQPAPSERKVVFVPGAEAEAGIAKWIPPGGFVHLHPASRWRFKCWPAQKNAELIERLAAAGHALVLTAAPDKEELAFIEQILARTKAQVANLAGRLSIKELGALTARARLFIGVDSMPMHLAAAMGTPTLALFGPSGELEWGPWNAPARVITSAHGCRPCGFDGCGGGKVSECLTTLEVERVHAAASELLQQGAR
jgi:heptosyltransferase III